MSIDQTLQRPVGRNGAAKPSGPHVGALQAGIRAKERPCRDDTTPSATEQRDRAIEDEARAVLGTSSYQPVRHVSCEVYGQVLILRGRVPSFYMKQIAQTIVRHLLYGSLVLDNQLEVDDT